MLESWRLKGYLEKELYRVEKPSLLNRLASPVSEFNYNVFNYHGELTAQTCQRGFFKKPGVRINIRGTDPWHSIVPTLERSGHVCGVYDDMQGGSPTPIEEFNRTRRVFPSHLPRF
jgi:hypothetical protein